MGKAIGLEIRKALSQSSIVKKEENSGESIGEESTKKRKNDGEEPINDAKRPKIDKIEETKEEVPPIDSDSDWILEFWFEIIFGQQTYRKVWNKKIKTTFCWLLLNTLPRYKVCGTDMYF